jgi:hypothetical protein
MHSKIIYNVKQYSEICTANTVLLNNLWDCFFLLRCKSDCAGCVVRNVVSTAFSNAWLFVKGGGKLRCCSMEINVVFERTDA